MACGIPNSKAATHVVLGRDHKLSPQTFVEQECLGERCSPALTRTLRNSIGVGVEQGVGNVRHLEQSLVSAHGFQLIGIELQLLFIQVRPITPMREQGPYRAGAIVRNPCGKAMKVPSLRKKQNLPAMTSARPSVTELEVKLKGIPIHDASQMLHGVLNVNVVSSRNCAFQDGCLMLNQENDSGAC